MNRALWIAVLAGCGGFSDVMPDPPAPRVVNEAFDVYARGSAEDVAVLANEDLVVVGCEYGVTFVTRIDHATRAPIWTRRSASPCTADNWTVPRVAVSSSGTIWVTAFGWGRGAHMTQEEAGAQSVVLLAFDEGGGLGTQRTLPAGLRVRALAPLDAGRIAIAGQSAIEQVASTAFIAAYDADATELWRTKLPHVHASWIHSLAVDGDRIHAGGEIASTVEVVDGVATGRDGVGFVTTLDARTGAITSAWARHYPGVNMDDVHVAVVDGAAYVAYGVSQRAGNPWPICGAPRAGDCLPAIPAGAFSAFVVEPVAAKPAWRRVFAGSTHTSVDGVAVAADRLAVVIGAQHGEIDLGRGAWHSELFNFGGYLELSTADGTTRDARRLLAHGENSRVFMRDVIWDGAAFTAVGGLRGTQVELHAREELRDDSSFVWRIGTRPGRPR